MLSAKTVEKWSETSVLIIPDLCWILNATYYSLGNNLIYSCGCVSRSASWFIYGRYHIQGCQQAIAGHRPLFSPHTKAIKRLSSRRKYYCFNHSRASTIQKCFLPATCFCFPWLLYLYIHFTSPEEVLNFLIRYIV